MASNKYHAKKTDVDDITFDSRAEAGRYMQLKLLLAAGEIKDLVLQERFPIVVNGQKIGTYIADFSYTTADGVRVIEDVKGVKTPVYRLKKKLVRALYGIEIAETTAVERRARAEILRDMTCSHGAKPGECKIETCIHSPVSAFALAN